MNLPWNSKARRRRWPMIAGIALGAVALALPLMPSLRRYLRMESM
jgi:hypothetical protein